MKINWLLVLLLVLIGISVYPKKSAEVHPVKTFSTDFAYDNRTFLPSVAAYPRNLYTSGPKVIILPHHLLASSLIAQAISSIGKDEKVIYILSPNHANAGQCDIISSENPWNTPYGQLEVNSNQLKEFTSKGIACLDDKSLSIEHGIAGLLPFLKYYLPNVSIIPFSLKKDINPELLKSFTSEIIRFSKKAVVLTSLDFSHSLPLAESLRKDEKTLDLINHNRYEEIKPLNSEYLDSPVSLIVALKIIESSKLKITDIKHSNSSAFNGDTHSVTSYFLIKASEIADSQEKSLTIIFGGDVMLGRSVNTQIHKSGDFSWPLRNIAGLLASSDISVINLESPFNNNCPLTDTGMVFCADPRSVQSLSDSGIDVVTLANNHISNQGETGFDLTKQILTENGILYTGVGNPVVKTVKGTKVAFVGFSDVQPVSGFVSPATEANISKQIIDARKSADLVIALFHWGNEYSQKNTRQEKLGHLAIDSGADIVIGHHPHWVQENENYKGKPIYYSLGNLVFDQMWSEGTQKGLLVKMTFSGNKLINEEKIPVRIKSYGQPYIQ